MSESIVNADILPPIKKFDYSLPYIRLEAQDASLAEETKITGKNFCEFRTRFDLKQE
jgi:hypothetical protein